MAKTWKDDGTTAFAPGIEARWRIKQIYGGYGAAPTGGRLTVVSDSRPVSGGLQPVGSVVTLLDIPVGAQPLALDCDFRGEPGAVLIATLTDGGAAIQGGITFIYVYEGA